MATALNLGFRFAVKRCSLSSMTSSTRLSTNLVASRSTSYHQKFQFNQLTSLFRRTSPLSRVENNSRGVLSVIQARCLTPLPPHSKDKPTERETSENTSEERSGRTLDPGNIFTIPNALTITRIALTPALGYLVLIGEFQLALYLFGFAGLTDLLDGHIARRFPSQQSALGSFLDPLADKLLVATLFASLTVIGHIPIPLTLLIIARDALLVAAVCYLRYASLPQPKTLPRYFDPAVQTAKLQPTLLSKYNTVLQLALVGCTLGAPVFDFAGHPALTALCWITAASTITSFISYIYAKDTYKIFTKKGSRSK